MSLDDYLGIDIFELRRYKSRQLSREMAKENKFTTDLVIKVLNSDKYLVGDRVAVHNIGVRSLIIKKGVSPSDIIKEAINGVTRIYLNPSAVMAVFAFYHNKGRIKAYKEAEVLQELKDQAL